MLNVSLARAAMTHSAHSPFHTFCLVIKIEYIIFNIFRINLFLLSMSRHLDQFEIPFASVPRRFSSLSSVDLPRFQECA